MDTQVAIVGAGPAGLAAALTLSRSMIKSIVFDKNTPPRNASSPFIAALPGFDRNTPADVRDTIHRDIVSYPYAHFEQTGITGIRREADGFTLSRDDGSLLTAEFVLLSTGMVDLLPELGGIEECWGRSVINCPFCHGIEWHNKRWGIYAHRQDVIDAAEVYRNWSDDLHYFIGPDIFVTPERSEQVSRLSTAIYHELPINLRAENGALTHIEMPGGETIDLDCLLIFPFQQQTGLVTSLDISMTDAGYVDVDAGFRTSVRGLYAAGDLVYPGHQNTPTALHMGNLAAATIVMDYCCLK
ncbi:thioredoxin reductase [Labrenzia sp. EL_195]|nr:thioredoxin reductase [Labrenzia sp. EL_195]